jgi:hypothetical protein
VASQELLHRREFGKRIAGIVATAGTFLLFRGSNNDFSDPRSVFIDLQDKYKTPQEAAAAFVRAKTPFLMASYAVFFPEVRRRQGRAMVEEIRKAAEKEKLKYSKDHHRLDALPALTAAHFLRVTKDDSNRHKLCSEISSALTDPRREVQEIVLQNLITAVSPNIDSVRFLTFDSQVLNSINALLLTAEQNPKLFTPIALAAEFLLNSQALLQARHAPPSSLAPYKKLLNKICASRAPHFWLVGRTIEIHQKTFVANPHNIKSLPPQSSEALMGWKFLYDTSGAYLNQLALTRARLLYIIWETTSGKLPSDDVMNAIQAQRALPKVIDFFRSFQLLPLITPEIVEAMPMEEQGFRKFMRSDFHQLIAHPEQKGIDLSDIESPDEEILLASKVPFSKYDDYALLDSLSRMRDSQDRRSLFKNASAMLASVLSGYGAYRGYDEFIERAQQIIGRFPYAETRPSKEDFEKQMAGLEKKERDIESGRCVGLEEQQAELGPVPLDNNEATSDKAPNKTNAADAKSRTAD